jgi:hypothetical protein
LVTRPAILHVCLALALAGPAGLSGAQDAPPPPTPPPSAAPASASAPASTEPRTATVVLQDGQVLTGELLREDTDGIVLVINGIRTTIERRLIRESYIQPPVEERYRQVRDAIADDDADRLVQLAEWLISKGRPDLALPDLDLALHADPFHPRARELRLLAVEADRLNRSLRPDAGVDPNTNQTDAASPGNTPQGGPGPAAAHQLDPSFPLISSDDVNMVRVYEIDFDNPPKLAIDRTTMEAVLEQFAGDPLLPATAAGKEALLTGPALDQLKLLFQLRAREYYGEVRVLTEPPALRQFRDDVHRAWLSRGCATDRCHGGSAAGRLRLARSAAPDARVYLTNMLILERYRSLDGQPIINFDAPEASLLLQAGLPRRSADAPHPDVDGWRPVFRGLEDGRFQAAAAWIRAMYVPRPNYGVDYTPPTPMLPADEAARPPR